MTQHGMTARAHDRILTVARTVADLEGAPGIEPKRIAEAIQYKTLDRTFWARQVSWGAVALVRFYSKSKSRGWGARAARSDRPSPRFDHPPLTCYKSWFCIGPPRSNRRPLRYETSDAAKLNTPVQSRVVEACSELRQCAPRRS